MYCHRCHRPLSARRGPRLYGDACWHRLCAPVLALEASGNRAAAGAAAILRDAAYAPLGPRHPRVFRVVSEDGERTYLTSPEACNCGSGLHAKLCKHSTAITILLAA